MTISARQIFDYAPPPLRAQLSRLARVALAGGYAVLVVLPCLVIALIGQVPYWVVIGTFLAYAFALLPTYYLDRFFLGGIGFRSPAIFALPALVVATMLWPLPLLSAAPGVWHRARWRRVILGYAVAFIFFMLMAAWQMTRSGGLFFG